MGKPDGVSSHLEEEKSGIDAHLFEERHLLDLDNDNVSEVEDTKDVELKIIHMAIWEKKNGLCVVPQEHRLEVLPQHHDSQVAGHWGKHRTQQLILQNFIRDTC